MTIAPTTATPSVWPNCREVVAIAEATPAWDRGIPDTAAFVMGALTNPNPSPSPSERPPLIAARPFPAIREHVDEVYLGCANQAGEDNRNVARMSALRGSQRASSPISVRQGMPTWSMLATNR